MSALLAALIAAAVTLVAQPRSARMAAVLGIRGRQPWTQKVVSALERLPVLRWRRAAEQRHRQCAIDALAALVAELRVGTPARVALARALADAPQTCPRTLAAARFGGDVVEAIRQDAVTAAPLRGLAAIWQVAEDSGSGLAAATAALLASVREDEESRRTLSAHLAGPRASARMLSLLPGVGLLMGMMLGTQPLRWLLSTVPGLLCLTLGVLLNVAGLVWMSVIARRARPST